MGRRELSSSWRLRKQLGQDVDHNENILELDLDDFCITVNILEATELSLQIQGTLWLYI